jgi:hypothetical protein
MSAAAVSQSSAGFLVRGWPAEMGGRWLPEQRGNYSAYLDKQLQEGTTHPMGDAPIRVRGLE